MSLTKNGITAVFSMMLEESVLAGEERGWIELAESRLNRGYPAGAADALKYLDKYYARQVGRETDPQRMMQMRDDMEELQAALTDLAGNNAKA
jgi:hypothetical protein